MINIGDVETEVLVNAIGLTGRWLATAARSPRGRKAEDLSIARWFETYKLTNSVPELPDSIAADAERVAAVLRGPDIQATLQELLSARLTDAPEVDAERARESFRLTLTVALPSVTSLSSSLIDFYDDQICSLVARLQADEPAMLAQIRSEAMAARMIAVLNAIERHVSSLQSVPRDEDTFLSNYRRQVIEQHGKLQPPDFDRRRRVPIEDIYVPGMIDAEVSSELEFKTLKDVRAIESITVWELADRADRSVLLGDPGGGKTTASNVLMHHFASNAAQRLPFLVTLRDFAGSDPPERSVVGHIEHELETFYQCPAPPGLVDMLLLTGRAIVFFDGLDELLDTARRSDVATRVERFCTEYPLAPVLITSRVVGYDQARLDDQQFTTFRLGGFLDEDVADYAAKWFALEDDSHADEADAFLSESESVPDLRSNPLLLSLMCILYRGEGSLPRNRAEIYEQCATLLFRKWDARRRIHQNLRAGHLIEPTLRHLAWWLFTRDDTHSAVTERALVNAATEFLHGRGFESPDEALEAAREFIEFCRGRMWVFTDTGTTATGETLYSFTHRTFLEYFAAAQLAFDSDTPEKLARAIAPHIARGEWEVVSELAVQIKDRTSADGARRVYETLLGERRRRAPEGRSNILWFLARSLQSVDPSPQVIRHLTKEALDFMFSGDSAAVQFRPISWLMASCDASPTLVAEEITKLITRMIRSDDMKVRLNGISFALWLEYGPHIIPKRVGLSWENNLSRFWETQAHEIRRRHEKDIITAAAWDAEVRHGALRCGLITVAQVLQMDGGLRSMILDQPARTFTVTWAAYLQSKVVDLMRNPEETEFATELTEVGRHLATHPDAPWIMEPASPWPYWGNNNTPGNSTPLLEPNTYLGGAAVILISLEAALETYATRAARLPDEDPSWLGPFSDLYSYIEHRYIPESALPLPDLPVPEKFNQVVRDWAAGNINLTRYRTESN